MKKINPLVRRVALIVLASIMCVTVYNLRMAEIERAWAEGTVCWVLCQPNDYVHVRQSPSTKSMCVGRLESGDSIRFDGKAKKGFCHLNPAGLEVDEAWIYSGYVSVYEPEVIGGKDYMVVSNGRVAARKCINGDRLRWVYDGELVRVHYLTVEWAVTNKGFIRAEYLRPVG